MYNSLKIKRVGLDKFGKSIYEASNPKLKSMSIDQIEAYLRSLSTMRFYNLEARDEKLLFDASSTVELLKLIFKFNKLSQTERISKRFNTVVRSGKNAYLRNTNRSMVDLFMICTYYHPQVKLSEVYSALCEVLKYNVYVASNCGQINRRVYNCMTSSLELTNTKRDYNSVVNAARVIIPMGTDELGVNIKVKLTDCDYDIIWEYQHEPAAITLPKQLQKSSISTPVFVTA
jgi:hypothetical protein